MKHNAGRPTFPFSGVVGQEPFKLALILAAINPAIGGVVISGPRGCAKSTLARGMAALLPPHQQEDSSALDPAAFVTLPLGASEEMLLGTLNLERVLNDKQMEFSPGLLSKAHGGVLYVDEVNLLPDNLVDLLLDVAASGMNYVERDGISHQHAAEFLLVGTMNPDEGELRPQLHDRFGLAVNLQDRYPVEDRVAIVKSREAFDTNPEAFIASYAQQQEALVSKIAQAREILTQVTCTDDLRLEIARRCDEANVEGLRADIVWHRAAQSHAAWQGRVEVLMEDLDAVAELVLCHRRGESSHASPPSSPLQDKSDGENKPNHGFKRPEDTHRQQTRDTSNQTISNQTEQEGDWGGMAPQQMKGTIPFDVLPFGENLPVQPNTSTPSGLSLFARQKGKTSQGSQRSTANSHQKDWFATLLANAGQWPPKVLKLRKRKKGQANLHVVLFDTSGSTLQGEVFARAKGVLATITQQAYLKREQIAVFGFGNNAISPLMARVRAPKQIEDWLAQISAAGGTPIREGVEKVAEYCRVIKQQHSELAMRIYIISDGRSRASLQAIKFPGECVWVDTEQASVPRGRGKTFARQLGAIYVSLQDLLFQSKQSQPTHSLPTSRAHS